MKNKMILTEDLFKELALPYCKNKENKPKKYSNSYYEPFKKYLERHNFFDILNKQNFEKFFLEFCLFYFEDEKGNRLDFSDKVKLDLLKRSGGCCAICGTLTIFPMKGDKIEALNIGAACHIMPASAYGPRSDIKYRDSHLTEIVSIENGIWSCLNCHKEIDIDFKTYTVENLISLKNNHEKIILTVKDDNINIRKLIEDFKMSKNSNNIIIDKKIYEDSQLFMMELYNELKTIEKKSIEDSSIYKILQGLKNKKIKQDKEGDLIVKIFGEKMTFSFDYHTNKNILVEQQNVHKEMKENFDDYFPEGIQFGNKNMERYMAEEISDPEEILEFFFVNGTKTKIIKLKKNKNENKDIIVNKIEDGLIRLIFNKNQYIEIDNRYGKKGWESNVTINKKSEIINLINLISDFDIDNIYMVVKFESFYYDVPLLGHKLWDWEV